MNKMDRDLDTIFRYIKNSYLPSHFKICRRLIEQYGKVHEIDLFGLAFLVSELEARKGYDY